MSSRWVIPAAWAAAGIALAAGATLALVTLRRVAESTPRIQARLAEVIAEGIAAGELRALDPGPAILALTGANVFYFISAPFFREIAGLDPRQPAMLARQRTALLDHAASVLFADPDQGRRLAARIASEPSGLPTAAKGTQP